MGPDTPTQGYVSSDAVDVGRLRALIDTSTSITDYPLATAVVDEVVVFDAALLAHAAAQPGGRRPVMAELARALHDGPGVIAITGSVERDALTRATAAFERMVAQQHAAGASAGDHFGMMGANDRVWNTLEKLAVAEPETFIDYYASESISLASEAWLGPGYQITSQLNVVNPGGAAQSPHRDYHLGLMYDADAEAYPLLAHQLSPLLTLQGAVAHCDMPIESGPTQVLPHTHKLLEGYVAFRREDVAALFQERFVQIPLSAGDALFFNPAVFHAAGHNRTDRIPRMANLLQVGSSMTRCTEAVDRARITRAIYPALLDRQEAGADRDLLLRAIAAASDGYAFPTNLDRDPPIGGLAPPSQADITRRALTERWSPEQLDVALLALDERRSSH